MIHDADMESSYLYLVQQCCDLLVHNSSPSSSVPHLFTLGLGYAWKKYNNSNNSYSSSVLDRMRFISSSAPHVMNTANAPEREHTDTIIAVKQVGLSLHSVIRPLDAVA